MVADTASVYMRYPHGDIRNFHNFVRGSLLLYHAKQDCLKNSNIPKCLLGIMKYYWLHQSDSYIKG